MTAYAFRDLDYGAAEGQLTGAAVRHSWALQRCLERLPYQPFRSVDALELHRLFYTVAGWYGRGAYDEALNEERLAAAFGYAAWLDDMWVPWTAIPEYVDRLIDALLEAYRLEDAQLAAIEARALHAPLAVDGYQVDLAEWELMKREFVQRRGRRLAGNTPASPPAPVKADWPSLERRAFHQ